MNLRDNLHSVQKVREHRLYPQNSLVSSFMNLAVLYIQIHDV
ncbi:MAG: palindromic element RPE3 domain-containing protein [Rickettsia endosymbiont of Eriopis connexa]|nr:palindromic element RPE3 domain-containing protein [Rickettsia endosymbiont of Eriopis connexa]